MIRNRKNIANAGIYALTTPWSRLATQSSDLSSRRNWDWGVRRRVNRGEPNQLLHPDQCKVACSYKTPSITISTYNVIRSRDELFATRILWPLLSGVRLSLHDLDVCQLIETSFINGTKQLKDFQARVVLPIRVGHENNMSLAKLHDPVSAKSINFYQLICICDIRQ